MTSVLDSPLKERGVGADQGAKLRSVQLPLSSAEWVTFQAAFPLTEAAWEQMIRVLDVMKAGLVAPPSSDE
jgi:hypothetical protein